jgi:ethanolamine utilization protein EutN
MQLAKITGTVTATAKDAQLVGQKLLLADLVDGNGTVLTAAQVAVDTIGAGPGDLVIVTTGSAARMGQGLSTLPIDLTIIAIVDRVSLT